jgi:hypothetical protein
MAFLPKMNQLTILTVAIVYQPQITYWSRVEIGECIWGSALSARAYTTTLLVMVDRVKGGGRGPPRQALLLLPS